jgi:peptide deformylase
MKLITDKRMSNGLINSDFYKLLTKKVETSTMTQSEVDELHNQLLEGIKMYPGLGIAANQLGINKRACLIVNTLDLNKEGDEYLFLLNPVITKKSDEFFIFWESCLSLHKTLRKPIRTYRHTEVTIKTDNLGELTFKIDPAADADAPAPWKVSLATLQTSVVQHEIDHLDGITIKDRNSLNWTQHKTNNYGRNDKIIMKAPSGDLVEVKFKKANDYFLKGYEIV